MPTRTGTEYLAGLRDHRQVIFDGAPVEDVTAAPHFRNTARGIASFYDFQHRPEVRELMTYETEDGDCAGTAFLIPRSKEDLRRRAASYAAWAEVTCGLMGRAPDYMNAVMMAIGANAAALGRREPRWGENAWNLYLNTRRRDLALTHTFVQPFTDRAKRPAEQETTLRVVRETSDGPIISGARGVATLAPWCDQNVSCMNLGLQLHDESEADMAIAFSVDVDTENVYWISRDAYDEERSSFNAPLSSRGLDEMDCVVVYDEALIPWEHIFIYKDFEMFNQQRLVLKSDGYLAHHVLHRAIAKTRFMLGLAHLLAESSQVNQFVNVQERLGKFALYLTNLEALAIAAVEGAEPDPETGVWYCNPKALTAAVRLFQQWNQEMMSHIVSIGASGFVSTPHEQTLEQYGDLLEKHYRGATGTAKDKVALFRLAWDLAGSGWGSRNELYERFFFGDFTRQIIGLYQNLDKTEAVNDVQRMLVPPTDTKRFTVPQHLGGPALGER
jgi:4-hydroxyphenylacetate 3-monooxygenase